MADLQGRSIDIKGLTFYPWPGAVVNTNISGDTNAIPHLMKMLRESAFRDQPVKVRTTGADGRAELKVLRP